LAVKWPSVLRPTSVVGEKCGNAQRSDNLDMRGWRGEALQCGLAAHSKLLGVISQALGKRRRCRLTVKVNMASTYAWDRHRHRRETQNRPREKTREDEDEWDEQETKPQSFMVLPDCLTRNLRCEWWQWAAGWRSRGSPVRTVDLL